MAKRSGTTTRRPAVDAAPRGDAAGADEVHEVAGRLRLAVARLHRTLRQHADSGLSPSQLSALVAIERHGSMTLGELAAHEGVAPPTITGVVGRLEAEGNVAREPDAADRRVVRVTATLQGRELVVRARERKDAWLTRRVAELAPADLDRLAAALDVIEALGERTDR
jgi:DNA-binding MarR family transcriptional regulator